MIKFTFFVHCSGWKNGGYENTHYAQNEHEVAKIIAEWNKQAAERRQFCEELAKRYPECHGFVEEPNDGNVDLLSMETVSLVDFAEDYIFA